MKGVKKKLDIYIGRCDSEVDCEVIIDYINGLQLNINGITCECLSSDDSIIKSFKVSVFAEDRDKLLNAELWPENVIVRKFFTSRNNGSRK